MKVIFKFPTLNTWEKLLGRWSDFPDCGEKRLVCAVIAQAITDAKGDYDDVENRRRFWGDGFRAYCEAIDLNPGYVIDQILHAAEMVGAEVEVEA